MPNNITINLSLKDLTGLENFDQISRAMMVEVLKQMTLPSHLLDDKPRSNFMAMALHPMANHAVKQSQSFEEYRVKFRMIFDTTNDEWEEILDWHTRTSMTMLDYLEWLYRGMMSGRSLESMIGQLE